MRRQLLAELSDDLRMLAGTDADGPTAELIWTIYRAYEREFEVLEVAMPQFTQSQVADEVEFAPATEKTGALIEGVHDQFVFEIDTGSPDPDTDMFKGEWRWERSDINVLDTADH
jgi:hypothetical protein